MKLIEALPRDGQDDILLSPGGEIGGNPVDGAVDSTWFQTAFPTLAVTDTPLSDPDFAALKAIDQFWAQNADRWRAQGII